MKILWPLRITGTGERFGYGKSGREIIAALKSIGVEVEEETKRADVALHYMPARFFRRCDDVPLNVLFTMFETPDMPVDFLAGARRADALIAPSKFCAEIFRKLAGGKTVATVNLGCDVERYFYKERRWDWRDDEPIRFLWCGAPGNRKGWDLMGAAWQRTFELKDNAMLYVKSSPQSGKGKLELHYNGRVVIDSRALPEEELIKLYHESHVLVNTSRGEGFGLIPLEMMATGGLVISPRHTGLAEFVDNSVAFVVGSSPRRGTYGVETFYQHTSINDVSVAMRTAYEDYGSTIWRRINARKMVEERFKWSDTARRLVEVLSKWVNRRR